MDISVENCSEVFAYNGMFLELENVSNGTYFQWTKVEEEKKREKESLLNEEC